MAMSFVKVEELLNLSIALRMFDTAEDVFDVPALQEVTENMCAPVFLHRFVPNKLGAMIRDYFTNRAYVTEHLDGFFNEFDTVLCGCMAELLCSEYLA